MDRIITKVKHLGSGKILNDIEGLARSALKNATNEKSCSQIGQDVFALLFSGFKNNGFFVEFGATDGVGLSNSHLLEKGFDWNGILAEPETKWHSDLLTNRTCHIETNCVWSKTGGKLDFCSVEAAELSTIEKYANGDLHAKARKKSSSYQVDTISLLDLLKKYDAPEEIDYLSVDTEGSELEILSAFDFSAYKFNFISIEHNRTSARQAICSLMVQNGYERVFETQSQFDDWYIPSQP
ncbi:MAG: FkbM family methyltransferase [Paracoccaceae bacterium]|nr:FkbM family methyltransferase [Paracoccaceae bacterium]MDG2257983.1 FkbM family methyltransferase [Paracoccaceae bacterium]